MTSTVFPGAPPFPVNLRLLDRAVLVVGAGNVAWRKTEGLLASGAVVTVVGPEVHPELDRLVSHHEDPSIPGSLTIEKRRYTSGEVASYMLAVTCTDDPEVNARVHRDGVVAGVWVNSADDPDNCDFTLVSVVRQGELQLTISTEGRSPALAMWLRKRFEREFDASWAGLLDLLADVRAEARATLGTSEIHGWLDALDDGLHGLVVEGRIDEAHERLRRHLGLPERTTEISNPELSHQELPYRELEPS